MGTLYIDDVSSSRSGVEQDGSCWMSAKRDCVILRNIESSPDLQVAGARMHRQNCRYRELRSDKQCWVRSRLSLCQTISGQSGYYSVGSGKHFRFYCVDDEDIDKRLKVVRELARRCRFAKGEIGAKDDNGTIMAFIIKDGDAHAGGSGRIAPAQGYFVTL